MGRGFESRLQARVSQEVSPVYPFAQLLAALARTDPGAAAKVAQWQRVLAGMVDASLRIGGRAPVKGAPVWVTLEVAHGGFATGRFAAGGELRAHERAALAALGLSHDRARAALNLHFLADDGRAALLERLADGCYRVTVPEEGALLIAAWLIAHEHGGRATALIDAIAPFADRLRFYPVPHPRPARTGDAVAITSAGRVAAALREVGPNPRIARHHEALTVWAPAIDRLVALWLETVEGAPPSLERTGTGELVRSASGQPVVVGGWPCRHYPDGWGDRARALLAELDERASHALCRAPEHPKSTLARLRRALAACVADPTALTGRDVGALRGALAGHLARHGAPDSAQRLAIRAQQARDAVRPTHRAIAAAVAARLDAHDADEGVETIGPVVAPIARDEATPALPVATAIPPGIAAKVARCREAPIESLVADGLVTSAEGLAALLPAIVGRARAEAIADPALRQLYAAVYAAFRRRRSLLLLDFAAQAKLDELPWIAAIGPWIAADRGPRDAARATLARAAALAIAAFPQTIIPNPLVRELGALAAAAARPLPLVSEIAADIFQGGFTSTFLDAAQVAARRLRGSIYECYYGLPFDRILALADGDPTPGRPPLSPGFAAICVELAPPRGTGNEVAYNGTILEQAQILTTHNLAVLTDALDLALPWPDLARACFTWICRRLRRPDAAWRARLHAIKNAAFAWRQLVYFLAMAPDEIPGFLAWADAALAAEPADFAARFAPALTGLRAIAAGASFDADGTHPSGGRRLLGWTTTRHWLLPADARHPRAP